jgi:hypothetical protein
VSVRDIPTIGLGTFAETLLVLFAIVDEVILAGNIKDLVRPPRS